MNNRIGMGFTMVIKDGRIFISDRSYARFLVELKHKANNEWREGLNPQHKGEENE